VLRPARASHSPGSPPRRPRGTARGRLGYDEPVALTPARGPVSQALLHLLSMEPGTEFDAAALGWTGRDVDATFDEDLQLALWLGYELRYRGLAGVAEEWETDPGLLQVMQGWEQILVRSLAVRAGRAFGSVPSAPSAAEVVSALQELATSEDGPSLSQRLMRSASIEQFTEFLIHRSLYHLKEADPHTWLIPRLSGAVKAAVVGIQADEYGHGNRRIMHAELFRGLLQDWSIDDTYGAHLNRVPAVTLLSSNIISLFASQRRWRGALAGHLALFEMTSCTPNSRYGRGHRRLGGSENAAAFFDEKGGVGKIKIQQWRKTN